MNSKLLFHKALTMCLLVALSATCSMVALAGEGRASGEIVVTGSNEAVVTVNGEAVKSGRTIFSSSTITTAEGAGAIVNLGKAGRIQLAPNTTFVLSFDDAAISGSLTSGSISVLNATKSVNVKTATGDVSLNTGDTASASGAPSPAAAHSGDHDWWAYALIFGGAVAGIVWATTKDNENRFGSSSVSPIS